MIYGLYAIRDVMSNYMELVCDINDAVAMRGFRIAVIAPDSMLAKNPTDFVLYCVGAYDNETGEVSGCEPRKICDAAQFVKEVANEVCDAV